MASNTPGRAWKLNVVAVVAFFLSGFLALTYEICWIRKASLVFGSATFALSTILAVFFAGLAVGSYVFGKVSVRSKRPLRVYAGLEIGVALLALASPFLFSAMDSLYGSFYPKVFGSFSLLSFIRFLLMVVVVLPPTVLMGGTLPLFCRQYVLSRGHISRSVGFLYGLNTFGAAIGCAVCGFWLIRYVGVNLTIYIAAVLNLVIGVVVWLLPLSAQTVEEEPEQQSAAEPAVARSRAWVVVMAGLFFGTGFVALGNEIIWTRFISLVMPATVYRYTLTLTVVLLGIVLGSILTGWVFDRIRRRALVFGLVQVATGLIVLAILMLPHTFWQQWGDPYKIIRQLGLVATILLLPALLSGAAFPLAIRMVVDQPQQAGAGVGRMTALNTFGGIAGALAAGFVLLPLIGLQYSLYVLTGLSILLGLAAWLFLERSVTLAVRGALAVAAVAAWLLIPMFMPTRLPADFLASRDRLIDFREGISAHVAVVRSGEKIQLEVDRLWQGENKKTHQIMAAHVPMLLHHGPQAVLVIGIGPGQTASRFAMYPIQRLDCVDIERQIFPLVRHHFDSAWMDDPRVRLIVEDGRNYVTHTDVKYDIISVEVGQSFRPGVASFYAAQFYRDAKRQLKPDGLFAQFLPMVYLDPVEFLSVIRTFVDEFPISVLWYNRQELLLIGSLSPQHKLRPERLALLQSDETIKQDLTFAYWGGPAHYVNQPSVFVASFIMGPAGLASLTQDVEPYRDERPYLEYTTAHVRRLCISDNLDLIRAHVQPLSALDTPLDDQALASSLAVRKINLDNIQSEALNRMAEAAQKFGRTNEVLPLRIQAVRANPQNIRMRHKLARALVEAGRTNEAVAHLRTALQVDPEYANALNTLGYIATLAGDQERAIGYYHQALKSDPNYGEAHYNLGMSLANLGRFDEAVQAYRRSVELRPDLTVARQNLGVALASLGRTDEAIEHFQAVVEVLPTNGFSHYNLGLTLATNNQLDDAIVHLRLAVKYNPDATTYSELGFVLVVKGQVPEGITHLRQSLNLKPHPMTHDRLGRALMKLAQVEQAIAQFRQALKLNPDFAPAQQHLDQATQMRR